MSGGRAQAPAWRARARAVQAVARLDEPADLEAVLRDALQDPGIAVLLPAHDGWVRPDGTPAPRPGPEQLVTALHRSGAVVALVRHGRLGVKAARLLATLHDALALAAVNARLALELEQTASEARRARADVVAAGDRARRRIERDLHDGAQQRLVATSLAVQLLRMDVADDALDEALLTVAAEVQAALTELRRLARGVYPAILSEQGLAAALVTLAEESAARIRILAVPDGRLPVDVEAAAYFAVVAVSSGAVASVDVSAVVVGPMLRVRIDGTTPGREHLLAVQDRVLTAGGRLQATTVPATVVVELPTT